METMAENCKLNDDDDNQHAQYILSLTNATYKTIFDMN